MFNKKDKRNIEIVKNLLDNNQVIKINNSETTMEEFRKLESKLLPNENKLKNVIIFWDDLAQYTTLGIIDCILEDKPEIVNKEYDFGLFFYRDTKYSYYVDFIKFLFKEKFSMDLSTEYILDIERNNYDLILKKSPASSFFQSIFRYQGLYKSILFCYRRFFYGIEDFTRSIGQRFNSKNNINIKCITLDSYKDEYDFLLKFASSYDIIMMQYLEKGIKYVETTQHNGLSFISPYGHNGLPDEYFAAIFSVYGNCRSGPFNSELVLIDEGLSVC